MKRMILMVATAFVALSAAALKRDPEYLSARRNGAEMRMVLRVSDDEGSVVSNAAVRVLMGMNFRERCYFIDGQTDTNGLFVIEGKTAGDEIVVDIEKDGYYKTHKKYCFITMGAERDVKDGKWQPYGAEERLELRRIRKPAELLQCSAYIDIPTTNVWFGFDMEKESLVSSVGSGVCTDIEVRVGWDGLPPPRSKYCACTVRFPELLSGGYYVEKIEESRQPYAYEASETWSYKIRNVEIVDRNADKDGNWREVPFDNHSALVFRVRTKADEQGLLQAANYGIIKSIEVSPGWKGIPTVYISYVFNPTPNDTNLEAKQ